MAEPRVVRSWPEFVEAGVLVEEWVIPPRFVMQSHAHTAAHGWIVLDGGFEQESARGTRWCAPGELECSPVPAETTVSFGDRGARCLVFECDGVPQPRHSFRMTPPAADALRDARSTKAVLAALVPLLGAEERVLRGGPAWIAEVDELLRATFRSHVRAADVARRVGVHRGSLAREYRRWRGRTVADQLRMLRLLHAREALLATEAPLAEVALDAGFADQSHFTREFRDRFGITPARYRQRTT